MRKVIQTSQKQTSDSEEEKLTSLQEVFLVNPFPSQAKERERMITVTSGLTCSGPYMKSGPIGSLVKMLLGIDVCNISYGTNVGHLNVL